MNRKTEEATRAGLEAAAAAAVAGETAADPAGPAAEAGDPRDVAIVALTAERDELRERLLRALAEAENLRKRGERERREAEAYGGTRLARDLLAVHDSLTRGLATLDPAARVAMAAFVEGIELTRRELLAAFQRNGIEAIAPAPGSRFDANLHQAMFEVLVPGAEPGTVVGVLAEGFTIAGRLLRAAQVGIAARAPAQAAPAAAPEGDGDAS
jgi:molecular chaperone GrpE